jgi:hypothetical protein
LWGVGFGVWVWGMGPIPNPQKIHKDIFLLSKYISKCYINKKNLF